MNYILNPLNIFDMVSVICIFISLKIKINLGFSRIFRLVRLVRIVRIYKLLKRNESEESEQSEYYRKYIKAILTISSVVFISSGILHFLNENYPDFFRLRAQKQESLICSDTSSFPGNNLKILKGMVELSVNCTLN